MRVEELLESILSKDACKVGLPSLERLVQHPFWHENVPKFHEQYMTGSDATKHVLKLTNHAKDQIKIAAQKTEQRLRDEQKSVSRNVVRNLVELENAKQSSKFISAFLHSISGEKSKTSCQSARAHEFRRGEKENQTSKSCKLITFKPK